MLRNFLYLNESTLNGYLSALENGLRTSADHRASKSNSVSGKAGVGGVGAEGERLAGDEVNQSYTDTAEARFERFLVGVTEEPERADWIDVVNADDDLPEASRGSLLEFDCEIFVPQMIRALSRSSGIGSVMTTMGALAPFMNALGKETPSLPSSDQLGALSAFSERFGDDLVVVGERDDTNWRVAGRLIASSIRDDEFDGAARVVGKVTQVLRAGEHKSLIAMPGMNLLSREQRRAQEKAGPKDGEEGSWLQGPALMLDILAVYR
ncbi:DUF6414 family protein [Plantibacter flavus]|uniref:DUF6414 family protein n=1 Tax=Plantibacter flavus TaxID=150123 RepID=UPI00339AA2A9